jgi:hypothetical protein
MSTANAAAEMPDNLPIDNGTGCNNVVNGSHTFEVQPDAYIGDPLPDQSQGTPCPQPQQVTIAPVPVPGHTVTVPNTNPQFPGSIVGSVPMQREIVLDDTELCGKTPEELLELIKQMREIEQMLDPILVKLIEDSAFSPQFDKMKKFRETNLEMLRLAMNIFNKKVESKYDLAPAAGKK